MSSCINFIKFIPVTHTGYGGDYDDVLIGGDLIGLCFIAYYLKGDVVVAVASLGQDPAVARYAELLRRGGELTREQVEQDDMVALVC